MRNSFSIKKFIIVCKIDNINKYNNWYLFEKEITFNKL